MVGMSNYRMLQASGRIFCTVLFNHHFGTSQLDEKRAPLTNPCKNSNSVSRTQITQVMCDQEPFAWQGSKMLSCWPSKMVASDGGAMRLEVTLRVAWTHKGPHDFDWAGKFAGAYLLIVNRLSCRKIEHQNASRRKTWLRSAMATVPLKRHLGRKPCWKWNHSWPICESRSVTIPDLWGDWCWLVECTGESVSGRIIEWLSVLGSSAFTIDLDCFMVFKLFKMGKLSVNLILYPRC